MSPDIDLQAIASRRIVYRIRGEVVRRSSTYRASDGTMQALDVYYPAASRGGAPLPAVAIVTGYPDAGMQRIFGRVAKDLGSNVSWAEAIAAAGIAVVAYVNVKPLDDAVNVIQHVRDHADELGIDRQRIGFWSCSGNVPTALGLMMNPNQDWIVCAALLYGYMLDLGGTTTVRDASAFGFTVPTDGKSAADLPSRVPICIVRGGRDEMPGLNRTIDAFVAHALEQNLSITLLNHRDGPHAFDAVHDSDETRCVIRQVLAFLTGHLLRDTVG